jgi:hypothetical protein
MTAVRTLIAIVFGFLCCYGLSREAAAAGPTNVSLIQLIANPDKFHGKLVRIKGFLVVESEHSAIFMSLDDAEMQILANAISLGGELAGVEGSEETYGSGRWMLVEGIFKANEQGTGTQYGGLIDNLSRVEPLTRSRIKIYP